MSDKFVIAIDYDRCTGCRICEMACSLSHVGVCNPERSRIRVLRSEKQGFVNTIPIVCNNCEHPSCEEACPTGATRFGDHIQAMLVDDKLCIGCNSCVYACPFGASFLDLLKDKAFRCDQCYGEPMCVKFCPKGCLTYIRQDKLNIHQKRIKLKELR